MRVTSKGQVTIPKHLRQRTGIGPGVEVEFAEKGGELVVRKAKRVCRKSGRDEVLEAYFERVGGTLNLGMSTDEYMEFLRGE
jgi:AbrB family looped-hinge helix DNA binding protein